MATQFAFGKIVTDGLVLALDAADKNSYIGSGTTWTDLSGNGYNGTLTNGPTFSSDNGGSIVFDGTNDYINMPASTNLWTGDFTINFSSQLDIIGNQFIFSNGGYGGAATNFWFGGGNEYNFTAHLRRTDGTGAIGYGFTLPKSYLNLNIYTISYSSTLNIITLFQNEILVQERSTSLVDPSWMPNGWRIGNTNGAYNTNGNIYAFKIYNRTLSTSEILQNYNAQKSRFNL